MSDADRCVRYVCVRADHYRHAVRPAITRYRGEAAFCPAGATDGHDWMNVPDCGRSVLVALGWLAEGASWPAAGADETERRQAQQRGESAGPTGLGPCDAGEEAEWPYVGRRPTVMLIANTGQGGELQ